MSRAAERARNLTANGEWRSSVAHVLWVHKVGGSNPPSPTQQYGTARFTCRSNYGASNAGVAQWQSSSLPSWRRGFDSRHPLDNEVIPLVNQGRLVAVAIAIVLAVGVAVAVAKPGSLGDDGPAKQAAATTTTTVAAATTTTGEPSTTTTTVTAGASAATSTTTPASGLGTAGAGSAGQRGLASTGGVPWAVPGAVLLVAAIVTRRLTADR